MDLFTAPILDTVEALQWFHGTPNRYPWWIKGSLANRTILPCLTRLGYQGNSLENDILNELPIQRVYITSQRGLDPSFLRAFSTLPGSLTHIVMEEFFKLDSIISKNPACFVNIRHIGTIPAVTYGDKARASAVLILRLMIFLVFRSSHTWPPSRRYQTSPLLMSWRLTARIHGMLICLILYTNLTGSWRRFWFEEIISLSGV